MLMFFWVSTVVSSFDSITNSFIFSFYQGE
jgi:hypothetical protein